MAQWNKLEISNRKKTTKVTNMCKLKSPVLNIQWAKEEITREIRKYLETNKNKTITYQYGNTYGKQQKCCYKGSL
jgi:hypothetical protein